MAKSLSEQLLAAGVVKKDRATKLKKAKHKQGKQQLRGAGPGDDVKLTAVQTQAQKLERDRALSRERQATLEAKAIDAQVRQLIVSNRLAHGDGERSYNYTDKSVVKTLHINPTQLTALTAGHIAIVKLDDKPELVPVAIATKISERAPDAVLMLNDATSEQSSEDDPYAEFQIPDDLTW
jgi:uncharacterized protein YaiL (DUF2058 family)